MNSATTKANQAKLESLDLSRAIVNIDNPKTASAHIGYASMKNNDRTEAALSTPISTSNRFSIGCVGKKTDMLTFENFEDEYLALSFLETGDNVFVLRATGFRTYAQVQAKSEGPDVVLTVVVNKDGDTKEIPMEKWPKYVRLPKIAPPRPSLSTNAYTSTSTRAIRGLDEGEEPDAMEIDTPFDRVPPVIEIEYQRSDSIHTTTAEISSRDLIKCSSGVKPAAKPKLKPNFNCSRPILRRGIDFRQSETDVSSEKKKGRACQTNLVKRSNSANASPSHDNQDLKSKQRSFLMALGSINDDTRRKSLAFPARPRAA